MLFEELVEHHRVDLLVADGLGFSFFVQQYQVRIHFCYIFSNQAKTGQVGRVALVAERHWVKQNERFAGVAQGFNVLLEPRRGGYGTQLAGRVNEHKRRQCSDVRTEDTADEGFRGRTKYGNKVVADADGVEFAGNTGHAGTDTDIVVPGDIITGGVTQGGVIAADYVVSKRVVPDRNIAGARCVGVERVDTEGVIGEAARGSGGKRGVTEGAVEAASQIGAERVDTEGVVGGADSVIQ